VNATGSSSSPGPQRASPRSGNQGPGVGRVEGIHHQLDRPDRPVRHRCPITNGGASRRASPDVYDLQAWPIYHHKRESIDAHLSIVFAALAATHWLEHQTGRSIKKFVRTARRYRTVTIQAGQQTLTAAEPLPDDLADALTKIRGGGVHLFDKSRVDRWSSRPGLVVHQGDSTKLDAHTLLELAGSRVRLFNVDGGHTEQTVLSIRAADWALFDRVQQNPLLSPAVTAACTAAQWSPYSPIACSSTCWRRCATATTSECCGVSPKTCRDTPAYRARAGAVPPTG
jgi:hypothetical protein